MPKFLNCSRLEINEYSSFMLITSMYYTREEQPSRISSWYAFNGLGVAGGGLIGYGIGKPASVSAVGRFFFLTLGHQVKLRVRSPHGAMSSSSSVLSVPSGPSVSPSTFQTLQCLSVASRETRGC